KIYCTVSSSNYSSCNACDNPTHPVEDCNKATFSKRYNNYSFRSILIRRSNNLNNFNRERFSFRNNSTKNKMDTSDNDTPTPPTPSTKFRSVYKDALPISFYNSPKAVTIKTTNDNNIDDDNFSQPPQNIILRLTMLEKIKNPHPLIRKNHKRVIRLYVIIQPSI